MFSRVPSYSLLNTGHLLSWLFLFPADLLVLEDTRLPSLGEFHRSHGLSCCLYAPTYISLAQTSLLNSALKCPLDLSAGISKQHLELRRSKMELVIFAFLCTRSHTLSIVFSNPRDCNPLYLTRQNPGNYHQVFSFSRTPHLISQGILLALLSKRIWHPLPSHHPHSCHLLGIMFSLGYFSSLI